VSPSYGKALIPVGPPAVGTAQPIILWGLNPETARAQKRWAPSVQRSCHIFTYANQEEWLRARDGKVSDAERKTYGPECFADYWTRPRGTGKYAKKHCYSRYVRCNSVHEAQLGMAILFLGLEQTRRFRPQLEAALGIPNWTQLPLHVLKSPMSPLAAPETPPPSSRDSVQSGDSSGFDPADARRIEDILEILVARGEASPSVLGKRTAKGMAAGADDTRNPPPDGTGELATATPVLGDTGQENTRPPERDNPAVTEWDTAAATEAVTEGGGQPRDHTAADETATSTRGTPQGAPSPDNGEQNDTTGAEGDQTRDPTTAGETAATPGPNQDAALVPRDSGRENILPPEVVGSPVVTGRDMATGTDAATEGDRPREHTAADETATTTRATHQDTPSADSGVRNDTTGADGDQQRDPTTAGESTSTLAPHQNGPPPASDGHDEQNDTTTPSVIAQDPDTATGATVEGDEPHAPTVTDATTTAPETQRDTPTPDNDGHGGDETLHGGETAQTTMERGQTAAAEPPLATSPMTPQVPPSPGVDEGQEAGVEGASAGAAGTSPHDLPVCTRTRSRRRRLPAVLGDSNHE